MSPRSKRTIKAKRPPKIGVRSSVMDVAAITIQRYWRESVKRRGKHLATPTKKLGENEQISCETCHRLASKILEDVSATYIQRWWRKIIRSKFDPSTPNSDSNRNLITNKRPILLSNQDIYLFKNKLRPESVENHASLKYQPVLPTKRKDSGDTPNKYILERTSTFDKWWKGQEKNDEDINLRRHILNHFLCRVFALSILWDVAAQVVQRWWRNLRRTCILKGRKNESQWEMLRQNTNMAVQHEEHSTRACYGSFDLKHKSFNQCYQQFNKSKFLGLERLHHSYINGFEITEKEARPQSIVWKSASWRNIHIFHPNDVVTKRKKITTFNLELSMIKLQEDVACLCIQSWWKMIVQKNAYHNIQKKNIVVQKSIRSYLHKYSPIVVGQPEVRNDTEVKPYRSKSLGDLRVIPETNAISLKFHNYNYNDQMFTKTKTSFFINDETRKKLMIKKNADKLSTKSITQLVTDSFTQPQRKEDIHLVKIQGFIRDFLQAIYIQNTRKIKNREKAIKHIKYWWMGRHSADPNTFTHLKQIVRKRIGEITKQEYHLQLCKEKEKFFLRIGNLFANLRN